MTERNKAAAFICAGLTVMVAFDVLALHARMTRPPAPRHWTARVEVALSKPLIPVAIPDAPAPMPEPYTTGAYCLPRPFLAEVTHLCRDEGGEIDL